MPRDFTEDMIEQLEAAQNSPIFLFETVFSSGAIRLWTGRGPITWDSKTWEGNGLFHDFRAAPETTDVEATGIEVELSGVSQSSLQIILTSAEMNCPGKIWLGFLDSDGAIIDSPYLVFRGKFDTAEIRTDESTSQIVLKYETELVELDRGRDFRYTTESQKLFDATDTGFDYVPKIQDWTGFWGNKAKPVPKKAPKKGDPKKQKTARKK